MNVLPLQLLLGTQLLLPIADQMPKLDVTASCKATSAVAMADSQSYDGCMKDEDTARDQLLQSWRSYPAADQTRCTTEASMEGLASYVELLVCLQVGSGTDTAQPVQLKGARKRK